LLLLPTIVGIQPSRSLEGSSTLHEETPGAGLDAVRRQNLGAIMRRVHVAGPASRSDLANYTGLNRSTVGDLVAELTARGLVQERAGLRGVPGRPSLIVTAIPNGITVLAVGVFDDSLVAAVIGLGGRVLAKARVERARDGSSPEATVARLAGICRTLLEGRGDQPPIQAISVAVAGVVRRSDGELVVGPNLGWRHVSLGELLRTSLGIEVPVFTANDADLAALAEHLRGAGVGCDDFVCLWGEVGVGAGIIAGGRPLSGRSGFAGEVGHLPLSPAGRLCHCGARGCWETEVGEDALLRRAGRAGSGGPLAVDLILAMADAGDPVAISAIESSGRWLAIGLATVIHTLNPERIAMGGFFASILPYARDAMTRALGELAIEPLAVATIVPARLGADGPLIGAAELAFEHWLDDPASVPLIDRPEWSSAAGRRGAAKEVDATRLAI
jgi:predicted NBD/HSP70 family sugar kinase